MRFIALRLKRRFSAAPASADGQRLETALFCVSRAAAQHYHRSEAT